MPGDGLVITVGREQVGSLGSRYYGHVPDVSWLGYVASPEDGLGSRDDCSGISFLT